MTKSTEQQNQSSDEIYEQLTNWHNKNPTANLTEIEQAVEKELVKLRERLVTDLVRQIKEDKIVVCPQCQSNTANNGQFTRRLRGKEGSQVVLQRAQRKCHQCGLTFFPPR